MDLGIAGRKALICGGSAGLGKACAQTLAEEGAEVFIAARNEARLEAAVATILEITGKRVTAIAADVSSEDGRARMMRACPAPDILVTNAGGPPPGDFPNWRRDDWIAAMDANLLAPIELIRLTVDGMIGRRFGRIINITSGAVKSPIPGLGLSNGARAGLTGFIAGLARETARYNVTINNLLPTAFATERLAVTTAAIARSKAIPEADAIASA